MNRANSRISNSDILNDRQWVNNPDKGLNVQIRFVSLNRGLVLSMDIRVGKLGGEILQCDVVGLFKYLKIRGRGLLSYEAAKCNLTPRLRDWDVVTDIV